MPKWAKWTVGIFLGLIALGLVFGDDPEKGTTEKASAAGGSDAQEQARKADDVKPQPVKFEITSHDDDQTVRSGKVVLRGTAEPGARLFLADKEITVNTAGRWRKTVQPDLGSSNLYSFEASKAGGKTTYDSVNLVRKRSKAEAAAFKKAQRIKAQKRAAARRARIAARKQNFMASAVTIPYNQLEKNADAHTGKKVKYTGQIFQIQEDSYGGGIMLISVTDEGYGFWTDNIWVNYDGRVKGAEEDVVTVYGTIAGSKSYETQIGGETYVPEINARYVVE